jgi:hypothetical protein
MPTQGKVLMNFRNVIQQLEQEKARLESAIATLRKLSNGTNGASRSALTHGNGGHARHTSRLSPAGRRKIADAQRARWAKQRQKKA